MRHTSMIATGLMTAGLTLTLSGTAEAADKAVKKASDGSWISVSGTVTKAGPDQFRLDYGTGVIVVEMDDFDFYKEGYKILENDQVVVHGRIDDDVFERRTIEAGSVFVENLGTHFYANPADEEDWHSWVFTPPIAVGTVSLRGRVTSVDERVFTINTGVSTIQVDTSHLPYNPMDDSGYPQIDRGDQVKVSGHLLNGLLVKPKVRADWLIELSG